jgi:hypothetical protein
VDCAEANPDKQSVKATIARRLFITFLSLVHISKGRIGLCKTIVREFEVIIVASIGLYVPPSCRNRKETPELLSRVGLRDQQGLPMDSAVDSLRPGHGLA